MQITITGASDDLIEIDGDIQEEWPAPHEVDEDGALIAVSDGTLLRVVYDKDGIWRFTLLAKGASRYTKVEGIVSDDTFDLVTLEGEIHWLALASRYAK